jgi:hypothetical protein
MIKAKFKSWNCYIVFTKYRDNDRTAILLKDTSDSGPVATATINLPDVKLEEDEVIIKDYSENEGMVKCLIEAGVISSVVAYVKTGFVTVPICKLNIDPNEL